MDSLPDIHRYPLEVPQSCPLMISQPRKGKNKLECPFKRATGLQKTHPVLWILILKATIRAN